MPEIVLGGNLKYESVECSSSLTVVLCNILPYILIFGNDNDVAWTLPELIRDEKPITMKCVGNNVYLQLSDGFYKIDTTKQNYQKI